MSNRIQIRHGQNVPDNDKLLAYELGYCDGDSGLYIGQNDDAPKKIELVATDQNGIVFLSLGAIGQQKGEPTTEAEE